MYVQCTWLTWEQVLLFYAVAHSHFLLFVSLLIRFILLQAITLKSFVNSQKIDAVDILF